MSWFKRTAKGIHTPTEQKMEVPDGLWYQCPECKKIMQTNSLAKGWPAQVVDDYALRLLREELALDLDLPSLEDFCGQSQAQMF